MSLLHACGRGHARLRTPTGRSLASGCCAAWYEESPSAAVTAASKAPL